MSFIHLHVHSHFSLLEGLPQIDEIIAAAKRNKMPAVALTDYGSMYGAIEFYKAAEKAGLKPIIGFEAYVARGSRLDKPRTGLEEDLPPYHLVLLAKDYTGYRNLMKLSSLGHLEGLTTVPRIDKELLQKYHEGILALSACREGELGQIILKEGNYNKAKESALEYSRIFGPDNFYLELQDHPELPGQTEINNSLIKIAEETGLPLVATRDVHYIAPDDSEAQDILTCIRLGRTTRDSNRPNLLSVDRSFNTEADITSRFRHVLEAVSETGRIADRCNLKLELGKWHFPPVDLPVGKTADDVLRENSENGLRSLVTEVTEDMLKRLNYELEIIKTKGYSPYFLAVADYVKWARSNNIITTTRGSAAGSLVSFSIGITTVNPLYFKLPFERFLNPFRPSPPDIDMDFADNRRDEVIAYAVQKYGKEKVAQIITFGTMAARGSVRDVGRALGFSYSFCDQIAKMIPMGAQGFPMTLKKALATPELYALYNSNEDVKRLLDVAQKIEGCARHTSVHAAGVVIAPTDLTDFTPVQYETGGTQIVTQYEMHAVEDAGVLKMDFLGIRNLSILGDATKIVEKTRGIKVDLQTIPWDDKLTYEKLARGQTIGLFQLGGSGMTRYLEELKPSNIFDIMAMVALYRPGPMVSIPEFIRRKHNPALIRYLDPRMKDYLDTSYGVITFQDDVLLTAINIAGYNWEEADKLRKAMGKKIPEEMAKQKEKFITGCLKNGLKQSQANELWSLIEPFAAYGFNKAHAASYAVVAYQTAYMKAHYPEEYMAAVLSAEAGDMEKVSEIVQECKDMEMEVLPPDVNESFELFAVVPNRPKPTIRFGLQAVKNVGAHIAEVVIRERKAAGPYKNLEDFLSRVKDKDLNKKSLESLIKCGALDRFGERGALLGNIEALTAFVRDNQKEIISNQNSLFDLSAAGSGHLHLKPMSPIAREDELAWEKELIGLYISDHPFSEYALALGKNFPRLATLFSTKPVGNWVVVCGLISSAKRIITKKGDAMLFVTLEDATGQVEVVFFPKIYENYKTALNPGTTVCLVAKYSDREGEKKLLAEKLEILTKENLAQIKDRFSDFLKNPSRPEEPEAAPVEQALVIEIPGQMTPEKKEKLKKLFKDNPGAIKVYLLVGNKKLDINLSINSTPQFQEELKEILK